MKEGIYEIIFSTLFTSVKIGAAFPPFSIYFNSDMLGLCLVIEGLNPENTDLVTSKLIISVYIGSIMFPPLPKKVYFFSRAAFY
jgi:hypothetical protein